MSRSLRTHSLLSAAALALALTAAADTFGQSPNTSANVQNSASPNIASSVSTPPVATPRDLSRAVGNYTIIVPPKSGKGSDTDKTANKAGAENNNADSATPPSANPPGPQAQLSQFSDRSISRDRNAPIRYNLNAIRIVDHVNALMGGFGQGAGFGFGVEFTTAKEQELKGYELYARALVSTRLYTTGELGARVGNNNTRGEFWFNYTRRTRDNFFGIGPLTSELLETNFGTEQRSYNAVFAQRFAKRSEAGVYVQVSNTGSFNGKDDKDTPIDVLFSGNPNVVPITSFIPGLGQTVKLFNYGAYAEVDLRNNERGLTKGGYFYGRLSSIDGLDNGNAFSDFGWIETELDGRIYIPIYGDKTSFAARAYTTLKNPKRGSQIPFYDLSTVGGRSFLRGFRNFRFRANNAVVFAGEIRRTIWAQNDDNTKGLDLIAFTDVGQVWGDNRSKTDPAILANGNFSSRNWRTGFGGGVQYRLSRNFAFRFDIAASNERIMGYLSLSPGF
ncbi:MAG: hypothetical protein AB7U82_34560 [Blastocatellales bacterium]